jgi:hypothetical protein
MNATETELMVPPDEIGEPKMRLSAKGDTHSPSSPSDIPPRTKYPVTPSDAPPRRKQSTSPSDAPRRSK